eukprot:GFKZ01004998.1.p2 GENE.GFKZ01004998.1~~GFKZ01004998.1.p2  ORF type:complete len:346 (+),score=50.47 GFKZ01004998.1:515-1552(+)
MTIFPKAVTTACDTERRVSIIGVSEYSRALALSLLARNCATHLVLIDKQYNLAKGEALDLYDALPFLPDINLSYSSDFRASANSDVVVITVGIPFTTSHSSRMDLIEQNAPLVSEAAFQAARYSPDATFVIGADPLDIMTYVAARAAHRARPAIPSHRVVGVGTNLDIARLRALIARHMGIDARDVSANIIGEHGQHIVPLWRHIRVRGMPLQHVCPELATEEARDSLTEQVREAHAAIVAGKPEGTSKGFGECMADLTQALLAHVGNVRTVCTKVTPQDLEGLTKTVYMSVPCKIGPQGVLGVFPVDLDEKERAQMLKAAEILRDGQRRAASALGSHSDDELED